MDADLIKDLRTLRDFLRLEAEGHVKFCNEMQARRTLEYQARGDVDADYRGLSGVEETKYWPFIKIVEAAIAAGN